MIDLHDLLKHEIVDFYSVEKQIIDALPDMIDKAINPSLKKALSDHLAITEEQKNRLDKIRGLIMDDSKDENKEEPGFFKRIFGGSGEEKCKGMEGILEEGKKMIGADLSPEALDAAIIAATQKVEHYEICGYGTALAYARELKLEEVGDLLNKSLDEEYEADDNLTFLAVGHLNLVAEFATVDSSDDSPLRQKKGSSGKSSKSKGGTTKNEASSQNNKKKSGSVKSTGPKKSASPSKKAAPSKKGNSSKNTQSKSKNNAGSGKKASASTKSAVKGKSVINKKSAPKKSAAQKAAPKKSAPKKAAPKKASKSSSSAPKKAVSKSKNAGKSGSKKSGNKGKRR